MGMIGAVKKLEDDKDGKASGPFLRARVGIEIAKPIRRGVLLKTKKDGQPEWFDAQYEKLPFFCMSCGVMGHSQLECDKPLIRDVDGKLPYDVKKLRAPDPIKKKLQSFLEAATETFGSSSSSKSKQSRGSGNLFGDRRSMGGGNFQDQEVGDGEEVTSPPKSSGDASDNKMKEKRPAVAKPLFQERQNKRTFAPRKRKSDGKGEAAPDLNLLAVETAVVPVGLVIDQISQLGNASNQVAGEVEKQKKQKTITKSRAESARVAEGDPRRAQ
jgi:hypothetical protein